MTAFWASPSHITAAFWASPSTLPGRPNRVGHPLRKNSRFRGKIENVLEMDSTNIEIFSSILKRFIQKALQSKTK